MRFSLLVCSQMIFIKNYYLVCRILEMKTVIFNYKQDSFLSHIFNFQDLPSEVDFPDMIFFSFIWKIKIIEHY